MHKLIMTVVAATAVASFGCSKKGGGGGDAVAKMTEFKDAMCKCGEGDTACANKVLEDQKKYGEEMAKNVDKDAKPDPDLAKKMEPIMAEYSKCSTKAMTPKAAAGAPPDGDKKPEEKKAHEPKPEEKKADDTKPEEKKADEPKPEEKKADEPKPEEKKTDKKKPGKKGAKKDDGGW